MIIKEYKNNKGKTICHITNIKMNNKDFYFVRTGKPNDSQCLVWKYENLEQAKATAEEYYNNIINF